MVKGAKASRRVGAVSGHGIWSGSRIFLENTSDDKVQAEENVVETDARPERAFPRECRGLVKVRATASWPGSRGLWVGSCLLMWVSWGIPASSAAEIVRVVEGTVLDASSGTPISGVTMAAAEVTGRKLRVMSDRRHHVVTDMDGRYSLSVPNTGRYFAIAVQSATHYTGPPRLSRDLDDPSAMAVQGRYQTDGDRSTISIGVIKLFPHIFVDLRTVDPMGRPVPNAEVSANFGVEENRRLTWYAARPPTTLHTGADGRLRLQAPIRDFELVALEATLHSDATAEADVPTLAGFAVLDVSPESSPTLIPSDGPLSIEMAVPAIVSGQLVDRDKPVRDAPLSIDRRVRPANVRSTLKGYTALTLAHTRTDHEGRFEMTVTPSPGLTLSLSRHRSRFRPQSRPIAVVAGQRLELPPIPIVPILSKRRTATTDGLGYLQGRVVDQSDRPVGNVIVRADWRGLIDAASPTSARATSDENGVFEIKGIKRFPVRVTTQASQLFAFEHAPPMVIENVTNERPILLRIDRRLNRRPERIEAVQVTEELQ